MVVFSIKRFSMQFNLVEFGGRKSTKLVGIHLKIKIISKSCT